MARPSKSDPATEITRHLAEGHPLAEAARLAGVTSDGRLYRLKRSVGFADNLRDALKDRLALELAPKAIALLDEIMSNPKVPARVRVDAAKTVLDRAGFTPAVAEAAAKAVADDNMATWTRARLEAFVAEGERQAARASATDADFEDMPLAEPVAAFEDLVGGEPNKEPGLQALICLE